MVKRMGGGVWVPAKLHLTGVGRLVLAALTAGALLLGVCASSAPGPSALHCSSEPRAAGQRDPVGVDPAFANHPRQTPGEAAAAAAISRRRSTHDLSVGDPAVGGDECLGGLVLALTGPP